MTRHEHDRLTRLTDACSDEGEVLALATIRFIAAGASTGDAACWDAAHDCAESVLGATEGVVLVGAMASVVRAIRRERQGDFRCLPATCCRVTSHEHELMALIGLARAERWDAVAHAAVRFCAMPDPARLVEAARLAGRTLNRVHLLLPSDDGWPRRTAPAALH